MSTAQVIKPDMRCWPHESHPAATNGYMHLRAVRALSPPCSKTVSCESMRTPRSSDNLDGGDLSTLTSTASATGSNKLAVPEESAHLSHNEDSICPISPSDTEEIDALPET